MGLPLCFVLGFPWAFVRYAECNVHKALAAAREILSGDGSELATTHARAHVVVLSDGNAANASAVAGLVASELEHPFWARPHVMRWWGHAKSETTVEITTQLPSGKAHVIASPLSDGYVQNIVYGQSPLVLWVCLCSGSASSPAPLLSQPGLSAISPPLVLLSLHFDEALPHPCLCAANVLALAGEQVSVWESWPRAWCSRLTRSLICVCFANPHLSLEIAGRR
jgi:hypothetical protein